MAAWEKLEKDEKADTDKPILRQTILSDTTVEAAAVALGNNPQGLLCHMDELGSWFGAMDKYAGPRGAQKDRGFWLTAYNGGPHPVDRDRPRLQPDRKPVDVRARRHPAGAGAGACVRRP